MDLTIVYAMLGVIIFLLIAVLICVLRRKNSGQNGAIAAEDIKSGIADKVKEQNEVTRGVIAESNRIIIAAQGKDIANIRGELNALLKYNHESSDKLRDTVDGKLQQIQTEVRLNLADMRRENNAQLEKVRETVDQKLQDTLEKRIQSSFNTVNEQLAAVNKGLGEVQALSANVNNLSRTLSSVKARGTWGEVALEALLQDVLSPRQYESQYEIAKGKKVDFVVRMPGKEAEVLLPIDSKFPMEDYERLVIAAENADKANTDISRKNLFAAIRKEAKDIAAKYIDVPRTTHFAIMYLPVEGLFAEVTRNAELTDDLRKMSVLVCGPTTISALLNSLQIGFKTLEIQKNSLEVVKALAQFRKDFGKFTDNLDKAKDNAEQAIKNINDGIKRTELITKRLQKVENANQGLLEDVGDGNEE